VYELPDLSRLRPERFWFVFPGGSVVRRVNVNLFTMAPSTLTMALEDREDWDLYVGYLALATVAVLATNPATIAALLARAAAAAQGTLAGQGIRVPAGMILNALNAALTRALQQASARILSSLENAVVAPALQRWNSLVRSPLRAAPARTAQAPATPAEIQQAEVLSLRRADLRRLRARRLSTAQAKAARTLVGMPVGATVRPLAISRRGRVVTVLGGGLRGSKAQLVISGPGYSAVRALRVRRGLAGGRIVLPAARQPGDWYVGLVDYSRVKARGQRLSGKAIVEAAVVR
jgi:hypothetical protein